MAKKVIILLAQGFEEVEVITPIDYLRRAGFEVTVAAVGKSDGGDLLITGSHGIPIAADAALERLDAAAYDAVVVPGGLPGADNLAACATVSALITSMAGAGKLVCAICAAPARVLAPLGLLAGKTFTCYPGEQANIRAEDASGAQRLEERVVVDGNLITSQGAGSAGEFAVAILAALADETAANKLAASVLLR